MPAPDPKIDKGPGAQPEIASQVRAFPARIGFAGTPEFAATALRGLIAAGANVVCVYTQPDRPAGRGRKLAPSAVKALAESCNIEVRQPKSLRNDSAEEELRKSRLDVLIVAAYGLILPQSILDAPTLGCINVHASLLPRWRGAAPIERAIMAGDVKSGVCIMRMEAGLDTGGVYATRSLPITNMTTGRELHDSLAELGVEALLDTLDGFEPDNFEPQDETLVTYANKLSPANARIDWRADSATVVRHINALNDRLPARTQVIDTEEVLFLLRADVAVPTAAKDSQSEKQAAPGTLISRSKKSFVVATGNGAVAIKEVQLRRGKGRPMPVAAALNGYGEIFVVGQRFGNPDEVSVDARVNAGHTSSE